MSSEYNRGGTTEAHSHIKDRNGSDLAGRMTWWSILHGSKLVRGKMPFPDMPVEYLGAKLL